MKTEDAFGANHILLVGDEPEILAALNGLWPGGASLIVCCGSPGDALSLLERQIFAVVVSGHLLPEMDGLQFLERARMVQPDALRILASAMLPPEAFIEVVNRAEVFRVIPKPWNAGLLESVIGEAVRRHESLSQDRRIELSTREQNAQLSDSNLRLKHELEELALQRDSIDRSREALRQNFEHSLGLCFRLISTFYPLLGRQAQAVVEICQAMAATDYFTETERHVLMTSAWIYDIGLVALDRALLHKWFTRPEACTREEHALLRNHPVVGQTLAAFVDQLQEVGTTIRAHHERYDGAGYPDGHAGESIPWTARCLAVAVAFVQCGLPTEQASEYLQGESGKGFDPEAVRLFFRATRLSELPRNVTEVLLSDLKPGMQLARGIVTPSGMLLIPEGQVLSEISVHKLLNHSRLNLVTERLMVYA